MPDRFGPAPTGPVPTGAETAALRGAIARARALADEGGAGVVAAVLWRDRVIALRPNDVEARKDPSRHAEIATIAAVRQEAVEPQYLRFGGLTIADFDAATDESFIRRCGILRRR